MEGLHQLPAPELIGRAEAIGRRLLALLADARDEGLDALLDEREPLFAEIGRRRTAGEIDAAQLEELVSLETRLHEAARDAMGSLRGALGALAGKGSGEAAPFAERVDGAQILDRLA